MDRKKKIFRIIDICLIIGLLIYAGVIAVSMIKLQDFNVSVDVMGKDINPGSKTETVIVFVVVFLAAIFIALANPIGLVALIYVVCRIINGYITRKNKKHPKFDIEYFRDDLDKISPAYMSYLIDFELDIDTDVPAHILKLELDGYIKEENNHLVVTDKNKSKLANSDLIILNMVQNDFKNLYKLDEYKLTVENEMERAGYIKKRMPKNQFITIFSIMFALNFLPFFSTIFMIGPMNEFRMIIFFIVTIISFFSPFILFVFVFAYIFVYARKKSIKRTDKGNEMLEKIYGLKKFLSDFTNLEDSRLKEAKIREYYLVYAIVLDINDVAEDEMLSRIKKTMNG